VYNFGLRLQTLYSNKTTLEKTDLKKLELYLGQAERYYELARQKLKNPLAASCDSAVHQHIAGITYLLTQLSPKLDSTKLPKEKNAFLQKKIDRDCLYMKDYLAWCRSMAFELKDKAKHVEILDSYDAYEFLLQWSVGLLSDKHKQNDHFVLGRLRFLWTSYTHEAKGTPILDKLMAITPKLLELSSLVRSYIQSDLEKLKPSVRIEITQQYCSNIRRSIEDPHYRLEKPCFDLTPVLTEDTFVELKSKHARLRYDIVALQKDMSNQTIKPHPAEDDKASIAQLRRFSVALSKIHEKRIIENEIENLRHGLALE
jgi:hypothetical protein